VHLQVQAILGARVPVLKYRCSLSGIECDISIQGSGALLKANFMALLNAKFPLLAPLYRCADGCCVCAHRQRRLRTRAWPPVMHTVPTCLRWRARHAPGQHHHVHMHMRMHMHMHMRCAGWSSCGRARTS
jgi:hypothetical protein